MKARIRCVVVDHRRLLRGVPAGLLPILFLLLLTSCATTDRMSELDMQKRQQAWSRGMPADGQRLEALSRELARLANEVDVFRAEVGRLARGYYISTEHDRIEYYMIRYLSCRASLWDLVERYGIEAGTADPELNARAFILAFTSASHLYYYSSRFVHQFMTSPPAIEKLNEAYHRSGIPDYTYRTVFRAVTSVDNLERMRAARLLFEQEAREPDSAVARVAREDPAFGAFVKLCTGLNDGADEQTEAILRYHCILLPRTRNRLRHSSIAGVALAAHDTAGDAFSAVRAILFLNVGRLKSPFAASITFSPEQVEAMRSRMQPGDLVMTFSDGYMSNIFLPGMFKHGITYVGSPEDRTAAGLTPPAFASVAAARREAVTQDLKTAALRWGQPADLVEAVAEGVIFNSLDAILDGHINRLVVLRPRLTPSERVQQLVAVFSLLGDDYDFGFNFDDGSEHCCTEVIYRSLHERGAIHFTLVPRAGVQTLAADDIIHYHLDTPGGFSFVLLAEERRRTRGHPAVIRTGPAGEARLRVLMEER